MLGNQPSNETAAADITDMDDIHIDGSLSPKEKLQSYLEQTKNPYRVMCGGIPVTMRFAPGGKTLTQALCDYLRGGL